MNHNIGDKVTHRHRPQYPTGTVMKAEYGCNTVYWVDFGLEFLSICTNLDLTAA